MEYIEEFNAFFNGSPYANTLSFLFGILGIIFTIYFYIKGKKTRKPVYMVRTVNLVRKNIKKIDKINILYNGNSINDLSITKIAFWNDGKETIDNKDVAKTNPLRLSINNDSMFLDAKIIYQKNVANDFNISISKDHKYININFDYFDFEEGIVLQIIHTGNKNNDISLEGQIKSVKNILRKENKSFILPINIIEILQSKKIYKPFIGWSIIVIGIAIMIGTLIPSFVDYLFMEPDYKKNKLLLIIFTELLGFIYILLGLSFLKRNTPKGFDIFNDEF